jgi:hypothetical protein
MLKRFVAVVAALDRLAYLVIGEFEFRPHFHAPAPWRVPAFAGPGAYQLALELCQPAQHGQHQASVRGRGIGPCVAKGLKSGFLRGDCCNRVEEIAG